MLQFIFDIQSYGSQLIMWWTCIFVSLNTKMTTEYTFRSFAVYVAFIR
jgi:hypothetical protein